MAVDLDAVSLTYMAWGTAVCALRKVSLCLPAKSWTLICGDNGSGKSSLLRLIAGEMRPEAGSIRLFGEDSHRISRRRRSALIAYVHQRADESLASGLTIAEHVSACGLTHDRFAAELELLDLASEFPFLDEAWRRPIETLSSGERQVLGIVLQLIRSAPLLLLDEAFSALDPAREALVLRALDRAAQRSTIVQVTHQPQRMRDRASLEIRMRHGQIVEQDILRNG